MQSQPIQVENANINRPLNQAVQQSNGAQFALMLSLLFESQVRQPAAPSAERSIERVEPTAQNFNLENSLNQALQNNQPHQFNLLRSLYAERVLANSRLDTVSDSGDIADSVLNEIEQGYQPGNTTLGKEAQKISLAATPAAA